VSRARINAPAVGIALLAIVGAGALWAPSIGRIRAANAAIADARRQLDAPDNAPELIASLTSRRDELRTLSSGDLTPIPERADVAALIGQLSEMLDGLGLDRREVTTGKTRSLPEASSLPMSVLLEGPFPSIARAVREIESLPRLVRVQRLRIDAEQPRRGELEHDPEVRADLLIEVFFEPREVGPGDGGDDA